MSARGGNLLRGTVQRATYFADAVDRQVQVEGSDVVLRAAAPVPLGAGFRVGETVSLAIAPSACIPLWPNRKSMNPEEFVSDQGAETKAG